MYSFLQRLNVVGQCRALHINFWSCPPFLFIIMGVVDISAILTSYLMANRYVEDPQYVILIVFGAATIIFVIGAFIIKGFEQIAEANRMKSEFISIVSHQLRSPLSIFKWTLDAWENHKNSEAGPTLPINPPVNITAPTSYVEILRENSEKMIQLVNMLLEVSRIEAGRSVFHRERISLDRLTDEATRSFAPYARASNVIVEYVAPVALAPVTGDREKVKMVIQNFLDNAIRYSRSGGRVRVSVAPTGEFIEWKVQDSGIGIPLAEQRYIFQKFFRSNSATTHQTQGSGLGLYIARSVIEALGGTIGFTSREGKGSTFWFRLPISP